MRRLAPILLLAAASCTTPRTHWHTDDHWTDAPPAEVDEDLPVASPLTALEPG